MEFSDENLDEVNVSSRLINLIFDMPIAKKLKLLKLLDEWEHNGSRKHARKPWVIPVNYAAEGQIFKDVTKNISSSGLFIQTKMPFMIGQKITMAFQLPKQRKHIKAVGEIVRTNAQGIGVKFKRQPR